MWRYAYRCVGLQRATPATGLPTHRLKGGKEQGFTRCSPLDLHHPPCAELIANQMFYAIGMLAYNVLVTPQNP